MNALLSLLILAASQAVTNGQRHPDAVEVFHCDFSESLWDANFDKWPDLWQRKKGLGYPRYLNIALQPDQDASAGQALKLELDGGAAAVRGPTIDVDWLFSYVLEAQIKTSELTHDRAYVSITFYDDNEKPVEVYRSQKLRWAEEWTKVTIGPLALKHESIATATIRLHLEPTDKKDLTGWAMFGDVWFARLPRMTLITNSLSNVYTDPTQVQVTCRLSGIKEKDPEIRFELLDASSQKISDKKTRLESRIIAQKSSKASDLIGVGQKKPVDGYAGDAQWTPPLEADDFGFYRVRVTMQSSSGTIHEDEATVAVVRPPDRPVQGEFGWTLPDGDHPLPMDVLTELCEHVGINWLKFPVWYGQDEKHRGDRIMRFVEQLGARGIEMVGMLDQPPAELQESFGDGKQISAANIFAGDDRTMWRDSVDPVMTRLSLKIRWWQLGNDHDTSFVGYPNLGDKIREIRGDLYRFGQNVEVGFGWEWLIETPQDDEPPWQFFTLSADPPLTGPELATYLDTTERNGPLRWALVEPIPAGAHPTKVRAADLVEQMISAKMHDADAIFVANPFDAAGGLMNPNGTPGELLLPWRTTALMLAGTEYLGSIRMPGGSENHIFTRDGETIMIVWNDQPTQEVIYLGKEIEQIDIWGRPTKPATEGHRQVIEVGRLPTFITGVSEPIARWRMSVRFEQTRLPSVFGKSHRNALELQNFFPQGVNSDIRLHLPSSWRVDQPRTMKMAAGEKRVKPFSIRLPIDATSGRQDVRVDFEMMVDQPYRFSVYREIEVGLGDVTMDVTSHLEEDGTLVVEQRMTNVSDNVVDFKCLLYAPNRRRQRNQVFHLGRGSDVKTYYYPNGRELVGQSLWLRAEEIGGQRILNRRFTAEE